ncbi:MAG: c-type cytochrome [Candidatus Acidiferrales bacterium]
MRKWMILLATVAVFALPGNSQVQNASAGSQPSLEPGYYPIGPVPGYGSIPAIKTAQNPMRDNTVAITSGRRLFVWYNCYACHGGHGGGGMGPSLRDKTWIYGGTDADIFDSISEGRGKGMPAWGMKIPQAEIWQIVAYIQTLGTPKEPDAPR